MADIISLRPANDDKAADGEQAPPHPSMVDIPGQLRAMADDIEAGRLEAKTAILLLPDPGEPPRVYQWGYVPGEPSEHTTAQLSYALHFMSSLHGDSERSI